MKALTCIALILLLAGCVPIGIRASTQLAAVGVDRTQLLAPVRTS